MPEGGKAFGSPIVSLPNRVSPVHLGAQPKSTTAELLRANRGGYVSSNYGRLVGGPLALARYQPSVGTNDFAMQCPMGSGSTGYFLCRAGAVVSHAEQTIGVAAMTTKTTARAQRRLPHAADSAHLVGQGFLGSGRCIGLQVTAPPGWVSAPDASMAGRNVVAMPFGLPMCPSARNTTPRALGMATQAGAEIREAASSTSSIRTETARSTCITRPAPPMHADRQDRGRRAHAIETQLLLMSATTSYRMDWQFQ